MDKGDVENLTKEVAELKEKLAKIDVDEALQNLNEREAQVLIMRFGLDDNKPKTLEDVGKHFNVTRERIRQIEFKALRKLKHPSRSRKLKDYVSG